VEPPPSQVPGASEPASPEPAGKPPVFSSPLKAFLGVFLLFAGLILLTHFIQNPVSGKTLGYWLRHWTGGAEKESPISNMILDFRSLPHWQGTSAPVAREQGDVISDQDHLDVYWRFLKPAAGEPKIDFSQNALAVFFSGPKSMPGYSVSLKRMETKPDSTVLWVEETAPQAASPAAGSAVRPWVLQVIPKPPKPVVFKKADS
jgi:hypothetical protein